MRRSDRSLAADSSPSARLGMTLLLFVTVTAHAAIDRSVARRAFAAFETNCARDHGTLWRVSLCGPVVIVDKATREALASDGWTGKLPDNIGIANTAFDWNGERASMVMWPLPEDHVSRDRLLLHERFHAIQDRIGLPMSPPAANAHLDSLEGRYLMRLEMRALRDALVALKRRRAQREDPSLTRSRFVTPGSRSSGKPRKKKRRSIATRGWLTTPPCGSSHLNVR